MTAGFFTLAGVVLGVLATQVADWARTKRQRAEDLRLRRQTLLIQVLRHSNDIIGRSATIVHVLASSPRVAKVSIDATALDEACTAVSQAVDELRVLGPNQLVPAALELHDILIDARDAAVAARSDATRMQEIAAEAYSRKQALLAAAGDLVES